MGVDIVNSINQYECTNNIEIVEMDDDWIIMDTENFTVTQLNEIGALILQEVKDQRGLEEIIGTIAVKYDVDSVIAKADALAFLEELKRIGLIKHENTEFTNS